MEYEVKEDARELKAMRVLLNDGDKKSKEYQKVLKWNLLGKLLDEEAAKERIEKGTVDETELDSFGVGK